MLRLLINILNKFWKSFTSFFNSYKKRILKDCLIHVVINSNMSISQSELEMSILPTAIVCTPIQASPLSIPRGHNEKGYELKVRCYILILGVILGIAISYFLFFPVD